MPDFTLEDARKLIVEFGNHNLKQLDTARKIATAATEEYGDHSPAMWDHFKEHGIWNDDVSVQASLATIRLFLPLLEAMLPVVEEGERIIREYGGDRPDHQYQPLMIQMDAVKKLIETYRGRSLTDTDG